MGYSENEMSSMAVEDCHPLDDRPEILRLFQTQVRKSAIIDKPLPFQRKDGSVFYAEAATSRLTYRERPCVIGIFRDITERKQTEQTLRKSEERFRSYFQQGLLGMAISDATMRWTEVNDRFCDMLGYSREEVLQRKIADFVHPDDLEAFHRSYSQIVSGGADHYTVDRRYLRKDGKIVYLTIFAKVFCSPDGKPDHFLALLDDITERKQSEDALRRDHRTLKHLLQSSDHERQLIAYEIHDGLAQQLAGAIMQFETYFHQRETTPRKAKKAYNAAMTMLRQAHAESRRLISGVLPPILDEFGVVAAIAHLASDRNNIKGPAVEYFTSVSFDHLVPIIENAIYRIVQESLANACQHSQSKNVRVSFIQREKRV